MKACFFPCAVVLILFGQALHADGPATLQVTESMKRAATFFRSEVASHGGYVYFYSLDLQMRWGEGIATKNQIWVQPPATPTVGMAYLTAYQATRDPFYLDAATETAEALIFGQLHSGGWTNCVDFDPRGERIAMYRNGKGRGKNHSSLDDGQSQSAICLLIHVDKAHRFQNKSIHEAVMVALDALVRAQFPCGAFPQVWDGDVTAKPEPIRANYPDDDWRTEGRIKNYWDMYTINDNVTGYVAETLIAAYETYSDQRYLAALRKLGDFLLLAQMPQPQTGWAQQYNYRMQPIWARPFEPPAVAGDETQEVIETLMMIASVTGQDKYLQPIPQAIVFLKRSLLPDGKLARYYELNTNRPLYMTRQGDGYVLNYDDTNLPDHYGWKSESRIGELERQYARQTTGQSQPASGVHKSEVQAIISELDDQGRWVSTFGGERLVGQAKMKLGQPYLSSEVFSRNLTMLSKYLTSE